MRRARRFGREAAARLGRSLCVVLTALLVTAEAGGQEKPRREPAPRPPARQQPLRKLHQDPPGCNLNAVSVDISRDPADPTIENGSIVNYTVSLANIATPPNAACNATNVDVSFTCPGPNGNPTGATTVLATNLSLNAGATQSFPPVPCTINVNPGVTSATARADHTATVHTAPVEDDAEGFKTLTVVIEQPGGATATPTVSPTAPGPTATATPTGSSTGTPTSTPTVTASPPGGATATRTASPTAPGPTATETPGGPGGPGKGLPTVPIPTLSFGMLLMLAAALGGVALLILRRP